MLTGQTIKIIIAGALALHGIAHGIALGALVAQSLRGESEKRVALHSWAFRSLGPRTAAAAALPFWGIATIAFLWAALSFWGILLTGGAWRGIALAGAIISILGTGLFSGIWPGSPNARRSVLNTTVSLAMNAAILLTQSWLIWPPPTMFGS
jgi:hypothetical protein